MSEVADCVRQDVHDGARDRAGRVDVEGVGEPLRVRQDEEHQPSDRHDDHRRGGRHDDGPEPASMDPKDGRAAEQAGDDADRVELDAEREREGQPGRDAPPTRSVWPAAQQQDRRDGEGERDHRFQHRQAAVEHRERRAHRGRPGEHGPDGPERAPEPEPDDQPDADRRGHRDQASLDEADAKDGEHRGFDDREGELQDVEGPLVDVQASELDEVPRAQDAVPLIREGGVRAAQAGGRVAVEAGQQHDADDDGDGRDQQPREETGGGPASAGDVRLGGGQRGDRDRLSARLRGRRPRRPPCGAPRSPSRRCARARPRSGRASP